MQTRLSYRAVEPLKLWYPAVVFPSLMHFCCRCMSPNINNVLLDRFGFTLFFILSFFLFFLCLCTLTFWFLSPSNTLFMWWWVVLFHNLGILIFYSSTVFYFYLFLSALLLTDLTDHMNVSWVNETEIHTRRAFMLIRGREATEDLSLSRHLFIKYELILFL